MLGVIRRFPLRKVVRKLRAWWRPVPLFGALADVRLKDHTQAIIEVGINLALSTVPIWLGAAVLLMVDRSDRSFIGLMGFNMRSGEFCLYATALLAPLYYFIFKNYESRPQFPSGRSFMLLAGFIILISGSLFVVQRTEAAGRYSHPLNNDLIFSWSWKVYVAAVIIVYLAHVYKNFMETGAASINDNETQDFVKDFISGGEKNGA